MTPRVQNWLFRGLVVALLTAVGWLASDLVLARVEAALGREAQDLSGAEAPPIEEEPVVFDVETIARRNIFNSAGRAELPASVAAAPKGTELEAEESLAASSLNLVLRGTWIGDGTRTKSGAWAIIEDPATQTQAIYRHGDTLPGGDAEVAEILPKGVKLRRGGTFELLKFPEAWENRAAGPGAMPQTTGGVGAGEIRQVAPGRFALDGRYLKHKLENLTQVLTEARAVPVEGQGFRLRSIKKGSIFEQAGLQNGDLLRSINGIELTSIEAGMRAFKLLRNESRLKLDINRGGSNQSLEYEIR